MRAQRPSQSHLKPRPRIDALKKHPASSHNPHLSQGSLDHHHNTPNDKPTPKI